MKKILYLAICYFFPLILNAQKSSSSIQLSGGKSWHGTGDMDGIVVDVSYKHPLKERLDFTNGIATTIHYGKDNALSIVYPNGTPDERLLRFTTAGIQLNSLLNYSFIHSGASEVKIGGGAIFRFQSSSYPDIYVLSRDPATYPEPFYVLYNKEKQNIFTVGYTFSLGFLTEVSSNCAVGLKAFYQNDTNGDAITGISLIIERNFKANQK